MSGATAELLQARHFRVAPDVDTEGFGAFRGLSR